jgi:hypothetical protein
MVTALTESCGEEKQYVTEHIDMHLLVSYLSVKCLLLHRHGTHKFRILLL